MEYLWITTLGIIFFLLEKALNCSFFLFPSLVFYTFYLTVLFGYRKALFPAVIFAITLDSIYGRTGLPDVFFVVIAGIPLSFLWNKHGNCNNYASQSAPVFVLSTIYLLFMLILELIHVHAISIALAVNFLIILSFSSLVAAFSAPFIFYFIDKSAGQIMIPLFTEAQQKREFSNEY